MRGIFNSIKEINFDYMFKNGTIMLTTLTIIYNLIGPHYIMVAFPLTLIVTIIKRQNLKIGLYSKTLKITIICIVIVIVSFIGGLNIYTGIVINLIGIFTLMFTIISPYNINFYKPYIMLYVFVQYIIHGYTELILAICTVIIGSLCVILLSSVFNYRKGSIALGSGFNSILDTFIEIINCKLNKKDINKHYLKLNNLMYSLSYNVYISRHKKYLGTALSDQTYSLHILFKELEYLILDNNMKSYDDVKEILIYKNIIIDMSRYVDGKISFRDLEVSIKRYKKSTNRLLKGMKIFTYISKAINNIMIIPKKDLHRINKEVSRGEYDRFKSILKMDYKARAIRYRFSLRMAITLTISLFLAEYLEFYKIIWGVITILSILQPYYEETLERTKERVKGNVMGIIVTGIVLNISHSKVVAFSILVISLYMIFAYKNYYRLSIFTAIASMSISSIVESVNVLIVYRLGYVFIGVIVVIVVNKYLFPYKLSMGISDLTRKILYYNRILIIQSIENANNADNYNYIRDLITQITLYNQKLFIRNQNIEDINISCFINLNERWITGIGYYAYEKKWG
ncbi:MAG: FUSC family protein [Clostridium sp.]